MPLSRRSFLGAAPACLAPALAAGPGSLAAPYWTVWRQAAAPVAGPADVTFPTQPAELVREMVGAAHRDLARVTALLARQPSLARAAWDWGFGDWEDALGAASHVGRRDIAAVLLAHGARPTIFSAAMLGQLEVVTAFIAAAPGVESTPGPHGISLLRHAIAGGPPAQAVAEYLKTLPGADSLPSSQPLSAEEMAALTGDYRFGGRDVELVAIAVSNNVLTFTRAGRTSLRLTHVGDAAFFPAGAPHVRIRFRPTAAGMRLTVHDPDVVLEALRSK
jgi:hypothetical protein